MKNRNCQFEGNWSLEVSDKDGTTFILTKLGPTKNSIWGRLIFGCAGTEIRLGLHDPMTDSRESDLNCATCGALVTCRRKSHASGI